MQNVKQIAPQAKVEALVPPAQLCRASLLALISEFHIISPTGHDVSRGKRSEYGYVTSAGPAH